MKYKISDGGATAEGFNETNDCVVRAIAIAARYSGPKAPQVQRVQQVFDPNLGKVVWPVREALWPVAMEEA